MHNLTVTATHPAPDALRLALSSDFEDLTVALDDLERSGIAARLTGSQRKAMRRCQATLASDPTSKNIQRARNTILVAFAREAVRRADTSTRIRVSAGTGSMRNTVSVSVKWGTKITLTKLARLAAECEAMGLYPLHVNTWWSIVRSAQLGDEYGDPTQGHDLRWSLVAQRPADYDSREQWISKGPVFSPAAAHLQAEAAERAAA